MSFYVNTRNEIVITKGDFLYRCAAAFAAGFAFAVLLF